MWPVYESDHFFYYTPRMTNAEHAACNLYCKESTDMISAKDFRQQLQEETKRHYLERVKYV